MYAGPGSGSMWAAAAAWDGLSTDLRSAATSFQAVMSGLTGGPGRGRRRCRWQPQPFRTWDG
ncbi:PPE family protein [Mycobacterium xenopi 3993]|nr:PPE family protein [Mycobacterium xenopi 3993]